MDNPRLKWNNKVNEHDDVYIIGDFSYKAVKEATEYLKQLKGHKHLIVGNHDIKLIQDQQDLSFLSIKKCDNGELQFINDHDYILLGPCGGVYKTAGKYSAFSADNDQGVIDTLTLDLENVITGASEFDVLNVG